MICLERKKEFDIELINNIDYLISWSRSVYGVKYSEDITQDVLRIALEHGKFDYSTGNRMSTWLCDIAKNLYLSHYKYYSKHPSVIKIELEENIVNSGFVSNNNNLEQKDIIKCIGKLSKKQQKIIKLKLFGYSNPEISEKMRIKLSSTKSALFLARNKLKNLLNN